MTKRATSHLCMEPLCPRYAHDGAAWCPDHAPRPETVRSLNAKPGVLPEVAGNAVLCLLIAFAGGILYGAGTGDRLSFWAGVFALWSAIHLRAFASAWRRRLA